MRISAKRELIQGGLAILLALGLIAGSLLFVGLHIANASCTGGPSCTPSFTQTATASNTSGDAMTLNNVNINNRPSWQIFVTQVWPGNYDPHPVGVFYNARLGRWLIFNEDLQTMPLGTSFNVLYTPPNNANLPYFQYLPVTASASNTSGNELIINSQVTNSNPNATTYATQVYTGVYNPHEIGMYYTAATSQWTVFNLDGSPMPIGATFNLALMGAGYSNIVQIATAGNTTGYITRINDPNFNGQSSLHPQLAQVYDPGGLCGCLIDPHTTAVWYDAGSGEWAIYNVDGTAIPSGAEFFISYNY